MQPIDTDTKNNWRNLL